MGVEIPAGEFQAVYRWSMTGDPGEMVTTLGLRITFPGTDQERVDELYDQAQFAGSLTGGDTLLSGWTFVGVTLYHQTDFLGLTVTEKVLPIVGGAGTDVALPNNCSFLIKKNSGLAGKKNRGRMYVPPYHLSEGEVSRAGVISSTLYGEFQGRVNGWFANLTANECLPVIQHGDGSPSTLVTSFDLGTQIATQRRRMRK